MYVFMYVWMYGCMYGCMDVWMYRCMDVWMYVYNINFVMLFIFLIIYRFLTQQDQSHIRYAHNAYRLEFKQFTIL